jgi:protocatechuate 3,4-dioxygenase beta subunit
MRRSIPLVAVLSLSTGITAAAQAPGQAPGQIAVSATRSGESQQRTPARAGPTESVVGTAILRGYVVSLDSGSPIRRAQVTASAPELRGTRMAMTDGQGKFEFRDLPAGRYSLRATKAGFVSLQYGQRRPAQSGTPLEIRDKQVVDKVAIGLPRGSVISGRIADEFGEPVADANVSAMQSRTIGGARRWMSAGRVDTTDDLGQFRLFGLAPGEYIVSATYRARGVEESEQSAEPTGFAPTYFPGVPSLGDAQRIRLRVGEENSNASFALVAARLVVVEGTVVGGEGAPVSDGSVSLTSADTMGDGGIMAGMGGETMRRIGRNGRFQITNVAPGRYIAQARTGGQNSGEIGRLEVTIGGDKVDNLVIVMMPGGRITGRVITDAGGAPPFAFEEVRIFAGQASPGGFNMDGGNTQVGPGGTFAIGGLVDPRVIRVGAPEGWILKSATVGGIDYADQPIDVTPGQTVSGMEIVLTNRSATVTGVVSDQRGNPVLDTSIVVFPEDTRLWRYGSRYVRTTRPDQEGRYRLDGLLPSNAYFAIAVQDLEDGQANDPAYLATVQQAATRFSLTEGEARTLDLKLRP